MSVITTTTGAVTASAWEQPWQSASHGVYTIRCCGLRSTASSGGSTSSTTGSQGRGTRVTVTTGRIPGLRIPPINVNKGDTIRDILNLVEIVPTRQELVFQNKIRVDSLDIQVSDGDRIFVMCRCESEPFANY